MPVEEHPDLLIGRETSDDAGVFRLREDLALIQTVDFFTPIVNDPLIFGRIAAANALSDVYAMGGRPLTALNLVCFPRGQLPMEILREILKGGLEVIHQAEALLIGGHSTDDSELKYGLSVAGAVHPDQLVSNAGARPGDRLILTKPLGTGILATAIKGRMLAQEPKDEAIGWMSMLNRDAAEVMQSVGVNACTDITGFGLLGHALEMAVSSSVSIHFRASHIPILPSALEMARKGMIPGGTFANRKYCDTSVSVDEGVESIIVDCLADVQTSGGLLIAVAEIKTADLHDALEARNVPHPEVGFVTDCVTAKIMVEP